MGFARINRDAADVKRTIRHDAAANAFHWIAIAIYREYAHVLPLQCVNRRECRSEGSETFAAPIENKAVKLTQHTI